ncbi:hypothetical protein TWF788_000128 [Orbilia oligospora]|uniref:Uncharacterized protein n=1 Tax=Orbilia oligospora TaxID=2813651 RepID=A0A7C8UBG4_ORBOL|nr:hypothetical protein TWF788_000128 [Orbilia oligospora]
MNTSEVIEWMGRVIDPQVSESRELQSLEGAGVPIACIDSPQKRKQSHNAMANVRDDDSLLETESKRQENQLLHLAPLTGMIQEQWPDEPWPRSNIPKRECNNPRRHSQEVGFVIEISTVAERLHSEMTEKTAYVSTTARILESAVNCLANYANPFFRTSVHVNQSLFLVVKNVPTQDHSRSPSKAEVDASEASKQGTSVKQSSESREWCRARLQGCVEDSLNHTAETYTKMSEGNQAGFDDARFFSKCVARLKTLIRELLDDAEKAANFLSDEVQDFANRLKRSKQRIANVIAERLSTGGKIGIMEALNKRCSWPSMVEIERYGEDRAGWMTDILIGAAPPCRYPVHLNRISKLSLLLEYLRPGVDFYYTMNLVDNFSKLYIRYSSMGIIDCAIQNIIMYMFDEPLICPLTLNFVGLTARLKREETLFRELFLKPGQVFILNPEIVETLRANRRIFENFNRLFNSLHIWGLGVSHWNLIITIKDPKDTNLYLLPRKEYCEAVVRRFIEDTFMKEQQQVYGFLLIQIARVVAQNEARIVRWVKLD